MISYKSLVAEDFKTMMVGSMRALTALRERVEENLVDLEPIYKDWDKEVDNLINFPNRPVVISSLKTLNSGSHDGGLKFFDRLASVLQLDRVDSSEGRQFVAFREELLTTRQKARVLVTTRSAAVIVQKRRASDVDAVLREAKALKVITHSM
jgi:hypothetical protein